jgi:hypothetical protein
VLDHTLLCAYILVLGKADTVAAYLWSVHSSLQHPASPRVTTHFACACHTTYPVLQMVQRCCTPPYSSSSTQLHQHHRARTGTTALITGFNQLQLTWQMHLQGRGRTGAWPRCLLAYVQCRRHCKGRAAGDSACLVPCGQPWQQMSTCRRPAAATAAAVQPELIQVITNNMEL